MPNVPAILLTELFLLYDRAHTTLREAQTHSFWSRQYSLLAKIDKELKEFSNHADYLGFETSYGEVHYAPKPPRSAVPDITLSQYNTLLRSLRDALESILTFSAPTNHPDLRLSLITPLSSLDALRVVAPMSTPDSPTLTGLGTRLSQLEALSDTVNNRLDRLEDSKQALETIAASLDTQLTALNAKVTSLPPSGSNPALIADVAALKTAVSALTAKVAGLTSVKPSGPQTNTTPPPVVPTPSSPGAPPASVTFGPPVPPAKPPVGLGPVATLTYQAGRRKLSWTVQLDSSAVGVRPGARFIVEHGESATLSWLNAAGFRKKYMVATQLPPSEDPSQLLTYLSGELAVSLVAVSATRLP